MLLIEEQDASPKGEKDDRSQANPPVSQDEQETGTSYRKVWERMNKENERVVGHVGDLHDGEMKQVTVDGTDVLIVRVKGQYAVVGAACPHYGGPLVEGALHGTRLICPWHHACFNVTTGSLEEPLRSMRYHAMRCVKMAILSWSPCQWSPLQLKLNQEVLT